uniref:Putative tail protein n=1 Tax=viral metagenome TaxID=1070528 RepID=A0A6H1Z6M7_9ZZZZ
MAEPVKMRLEVKGVPELLKKLAALKVDVEQAVAASLLAAAFVVSNDAKRRAPRLTGNLARSITPGVGTDPLGSSGAIEHTQGTLPEQSVKSLSGELRADGKATAYVATNVVYAPAQEFLPLEHRHGVSPYLRPALDENKQNVTDTYRKGLEQVIRRAGK